MKNILFLTFLTLIYSCANDKPKNKMYIPNALAEDSINCDLNIDSILEQYTHGSLSIKKWFTKNPLVEISFSSDGELKGPVKKVRLKRYKYDKRFDEDHWDLTFNETTEFNQNKNPIKIYRDRYIKEISYDSTIKSRSILSLEVDSTSYNGTRNSAPGFKLKLSTETKNNNEIIIVNKENFLLGGNFYNYSYLLSNEYKQKLKKILNKDLSYLDYISTTKSYLDSLGRVSKEISYAPKYWSKGLWEKYRDTQDSVVLKYNRSYRGIIIKKYTEDGKRFIEADIVYNRESNSLSINNF